MSNLADIKELNKVHSNINATFNTAQGKEVLEFLEEACGWYESIYDPVNRDRTLINAGRREVVATIKTFLKHSPDELHHLVQQKEQ